MSFDTPMHETDIPTSWEPRARPALRRPRPGCEGTLVAPGVKRWSVRKLPWQAARAACWPLCDQYPPGGRRS